MRCPAYAFHEVPQIGIPIQTPPLHTTPSILVSGLPVAGLTHSTSYFGVWGTRGLSSFGLNHLIPLWALYRPANSGPSVYASAIFWNNSNTSNAKLTHMPVPRINFNTFFWPTALANRQPPQVNYMSSHPQKSICRRTSTLAVDILGHIEFCVWLDTLPPCKALRISRRLRTCQLWAPFLSTCGNKELETCVSEGVFGALS